MKTFPVNAGKYYFKDKEIEYYTALLEKKEQELKLKGSKGEKLYGIISRFSELKTSLCDFSGGIIKIGRSAEITEQQKADLRSGLMELWPWRKGPFEVFGIHVDTEWRSDLKWDRVKNAISPLHRRHILDIGSNSGYYMFRMLEHNPGLLLGIEPYPVFYFQFELLNSIAGKENIYTLPIRFEEMYIPGKKFNTVFCMGILYHRISPVEFLKNIRLIMAAKGELVLETLVLEGEDHICLYPPERYSKMRNVYFIPTIPVLESWLKKAGFREITCIDITKTTEDEQRETEWVKTESLKDFLDPHDCSKTVEGFQAPIRAVIIARV
jgi:tRNA (mo5U34)-methyltransferase